MRRRTALIAIGAAVALAAAAAATAVWVDQTSSAILSARYPAAAEALRAPVSPGAAREGARLARLNGCIACHGAQLTGGSVSHGVFGFHLAAPNLTRAAAHMSDAQMAAAIRFGIAPDGRALFEMPSEDYVRLSDTDVAAMIAYLKSLTPRPDAVAPTRWDFEGRLLVAAGFLTNEAEATDRTGLGPVATPQEPLALGRYLTQAQCSVCHGPDLGGDPQMDSPDLRSEAKTYSLAQFQHFFATGAPLKGHDTAIMSHAIAVGLKYLTPQETAAIYAYLRAPKGGNR